MPNKNFKIFCGRASLIGDTIMFLPVLNILEKLYPNSYKIFPISKKTSQSAPLFINHPLIDKIYILENYESLSQNDIALINKCQLAINPFPNHPDGPPGQMNPWWNRFSCIEETVRMAGFDINLYHQLSKTERKPKLEKWFNIDKIKNTISIWPFSGYYNDPARNPSPKWWNNCLKEIELEFDCSFIHFGSNNEPFLGEGIKNYLKLTNLPFFEQIRLTLGCDLAINCDSGSGWVIGSYGHKQINLMFKRQFQNCNFKAFSPSNHLNNSIDIFTSLGNDSINPLDIIKGILNFI